MDLTMLTFFQSQERTKEQLEELLEQSDLKVRSFSFDFIPDRTGIETDADRIVEQDLLHSIEPPRRRDCHQMSHSFV